MLPITGAAASSASAARSIRARIEPQRRLGALDIAADPEQIVGGAARQQAGGALHLHAFRRRQQRRLRRPGRPLSTQASAVAAPRCRLTARASALSAMRTKPPGMTCQRVADFGEEQPQRERPRLQAAVAPDRHGRQRHRLLRDVIDAAVARSPATSSRRCAASSSATGTSLPSWQVGHDIGEGRRDDHAVELLDHRVAHIGAAEPPGRDVGHGQLLAEHGRRQRRQEGQHGARLDQAGAERIGDGDLPSRTACTRPATPRREAALSSSGSAKSASTPAQQHFGAAQARDGADEDAVVAHDQVFALDQQQAEIARQIGVLEIGLVHRPRRQQADARVVVAVERDRARRCKAWKNGATRCTCVAR